jgi:SAM-dependent methyltransferase
MAVIRENSASVVGQSLKTSRESEPTMSESSTVSSVARVTAGYDAVANAYDKKFANELDHKPLDRALLSAVCEMTDQGTLADVGCGPGHISRFLAERRHDVVGLDVCTEMITIARRRNPALRFDVASMLDLPTPDNAWMGAISLYSIIHFNVAERLRAFSELFRTLRPTGRLLVAFHVEGAGFAPGDVNYLREFLGHPVQMEGYFLDPSTVIGDLTMTGFAVAARLDREPIPDVEFPSRRCYVLAEK